MRRDLYCESFPNPSLTYLLFHKLTWLNSLPLVSLLTLHFERNLETLLQVIEEEKEDTECYYESTIVVEIETNFYSFSVVLCSFFKFNISRMFLGRSVSEREKTLRFFTKLNSSFNKFPILKLVWQSKKKEVGKHILLNQLLR